MQKLLIIVAIAFPQVKWQRSISIRTRTSFYGVRSMAPFGRLSRVKSSGANPAVAGMLSRFLNKTAKDTLPVPAICRYRPHITFHCDALK